MERLADGIASAGFEIGPTTEPPEKRLETEGKIARVETDRIYLNVGSDAGVAPGDRFEILRLGEPILDPDTGEPLGADWLVAGTVEVTRVIGGRLSVAAPVSGGPFRVGDRAVSEGDRGSLPR